MYYRIIAPEKSRCFMLYGSRSEPPSSILPFFPSLSRVVQAHPSAVVSRTTCHSTESLEPAHYTFICLLIAPPHTRTAMSSYTRLGLVFPNSAAFPEIYCAFSTYQEGHQSIVSQAALPTKKHTSQGIAIEARSLKYASI